MAVNLKVNNFMLMLITILVLLNPSYAFFRHLCHGQLAVGRIDPLMAPGRASQHVHNIQGAQSKFCHNLIHELTQLTTCADFGLDFDIDHLVASNCTSCSVRQDKSAYWSPQMYFQHENGTFELVPTSGGLTA